MFKENKYEIIKKALSGEMANFLFTYLKLKKRVQDKMIEDNYLSPYNDDMGTYRDELCQGVWSCYSDLANETLLSILKSKVEKVAKCKLIEMYSYARLYTKNSVLPKHKDREACAISSTLNVGGDPWPIYLEPGIEIKLKPGDMLLYSGCDLFHWREKFKGELCGQIFLHYNDISQKKELNYDRRPFLGLPKLFRKAVDEL